MRRAVLVSVLLVSSCGGSSSAPVIEQLDTSVAVQTDGSALVQQHFVVQLGAAPVSEFRWRLPVWHHDGVSNIDGSIEASMDGARYVPGTGAGHIEARQGQALDVRWRFAPATAAHVFGLSYRVTNAVFVSGIRGTASFLAIPAKGRPNVSSARITMTVPNSTVLLDDPWVDEAGWTVTREAHGMTAARAPVPSGESASVGLEFTIDGLPLTVPQWQLDEDLGEQFVPAFISGALFILVVAAGILWMLRMKYPRWRSAPDAAPARTGEAGELWRARRRSGGVVVDALIEDGLVDRERVIVARDLRRAGVAVIVLGLVSWPVTRWVMWQYGAWPSVLPWSIVVGGFLFVVGAARFPILTEAGAGARVLYCARISDGKTTA